MIENSCGKPFGCFPYYDNLYADYESYISFL